MSVASIPNYGNGDVAQQDVDRSSARLEQASLNNQYRMNRYAELNMLQQDQNVRVGLHSNQSNAMKGIIDKVQL